MCHLGYSVCLYAPTKVPDCNGYVAASDESVADSAVGQQVPAQDDVLAYPTAERIAQKERLKELKAKGLEPKKRKQKVEEHWDDCGADLTSLPDPGEDPPES